MWISKEDDERVLTANKNVIKRSVELSKKMGLDHPYLYPNYAMQHQDVFAGYGKANRKKLQKIQKK